MVWSVIGRSRGSCRELYFQGAKTTSSLSFLLCHPKAEAAELVVINELDSGLFKCRLNSDERRARTASIFNVFQQTARAEQNTKRRQQPNFECGAFNHSSSPRQSVAEAGPAANR
jgi:hypothetical protein